jgi:hypothetical protein
VLSLYIMVNLCFIARHVNKFFTTSLKNGGALLETILSGLSNQIKTCLYRNCVTPCFTKNFKARTSTNFVK